VAQGIQFESEINPCALVIYFEVSDDVMTARLMNRGEQFLKKFTKDELNFRLNMLEKGLTSGRVDDNEETIRKRLDTFHKHSLPVVEHYGTKCRTVNDLS
jgi:adenylate kinase